MSLWCLMFSGFYTQQQETQKGSMMCKRFSRVWARAACFKICLSNRPLLHRKQLSLPHLTLQSCILKNKCFTRMAGNKIWHPLPHWGKIWALKQFLFGAQSSPTIRKLSDIKPALEAHKTLLNLRHGTLQPNENKTHTQFNKRWRMSIPNLIC